MHYLYSLPGEIAGSGETKVTPGTGSVAVTGYAPIVGTGYGSSPGAGAVTITGFAPTVTTFGEVSVAPGVGRITVQGFEPTIVGHPFTPPILGAGDDSKPLHWRRRDPRMRPVFSTVLRRKVSDEAPADAEVEPEDDDDLYKDAAERAAMLAELDEQIAALRRENAARGLARMARDAGRRQAAERVRQASARATEHAAKAAGIARRIAAGRFLDEDE